MEFITNDDPTKIIEPCKEAFDAPTTPIAPQHPSILTGSFPSVRFVRCDKFNGVVSTQLFIEGVAIIRPVTDQALRILIDPKILECRFNEGYFMRRSAGNAHCERKTRAVCNCHDLAALPVLGFSDFKPLFLAPAKVPSIKHPVMSIFPRSFKSVARAISMLLQTPLFTQCWNRWWHVWHGVYLPGRSFHVAPVHNIQRIPLRISQSFRSGLPLPSGFFFGVVIVVYQFPLFGCEFHVT